MFLLIASNSIGLVFVGNMSMMGRHNMGSMLKVYSLHRLTGGLGDLVVNVRALDFGNNMTVFNLNWYKLHLGVVNTMLSGNLAACVLHFSCDRVSNSMGNWERRNRVSNNWGLINKGTRSNDQWISFSSCSSISLCISFTLTNLMIPISWLITESLHDLLAYLLILNFLCFYSFGLTNILREWDTRLSFEDFMIRLAFWCRSCVVVCSGIMVVRVSLGISVSYCFSFSFCSRSCTCSNKKT